ncbi:hypothetical protein D5S18_27765 [Nocardia panacis]|uniref:Uncharacterized protein n=1 Tax=Nocardia panacis TaxID=2340916 RepID=A0A3A4JWE5_9NOCA|nr:Clp protease N-terminal domain-containing protein [Nocardia panacis]RJO70972.1 hypothetical protein D5S18_27765 [Nocardia panacis]
MTSIDRDNTLTTITGAAPGVIIALRRAARIAAEHGHNYIGTEDLLAALLTAEPMPLLEVQWQLRGGGALTFPEVRGLVESIIPGPAIGNHGPAEPPRVEFEWSGPHAAAFTEAINRRS